MITLCLSLVSARPSCILDWCKISSSGWPPVYWPQDRLSLVSASSRPPRLSVPAGCWWTDARFLVPAGRWFDWGKFYWFQLAAGLTNARFVTCAFIRVFNSSGLRPQILSLQVSICPLRDFSRDFLSESLNLMGMQDAAGVECFFGVFGSGGPWYQ